jgi:hypothetical protein
MLVFGLLLELCRERGAALVLVTHDAELAARAQPRAAPKRRCAACGVICAGARRGYQVDAPGQLDQQVAGQRQPQREQHQSQRQRRYQDLPSSRSASRPRRKNFPPPQSGGGAKCWLDPGITHWPMAQATT